jgi:hypothetical protein
MGMRHEWRMFEACLTVSHETVERGRLSYSGVVEGRKILVRNHRKTEVQLYCAVQNVELIRREASQSYPRFDQLRVDGESTRLDDPMHLKNLRSGYLHGFHAELCQSIA